MVQSQTQNPKNNRSTRDSREENLFRYKSKVSGVDPVGGEVSREEVKGNPVEVRRHDKRLNQSGKDLRLRNLCDRGVRIW